MTVRVQRVGGVSWRDFVIDVRLGLRLYQVRVLRGRPHKITPFPLRLA